MTMPIIERIFGLNKEELIPIIDWYIKFRLVAAFALGVFWITIYYLFLRSVTSFLPVFAICLLEILVNLPYMLWWKSEKHLGSLALLQLWIDLLIVSLAVFLLGGSNSLFSIVIIIPILSSSLLSLRACLSTAILASVFYLMIIFIEINFFVFSSFASFIPPDTVKMVRPIFLISIFFLTVLQLNYYTQNIRKKSKELDQSRSQVSELEAQLEKKLEATNAELYRKNQELRESEEKFRLTFENANDAIFWGNPKTGIIINCNKAAETLLEKKRNEIVGHFQTTVHPPEKAEDYTNMFKKHIEHKGFVNDEAEVITKSGKIKPVQITASVTHLGKESVIQGIFHDITERKKSEEKYRSMMEGIQEAVLITDFKGEIVFGNSAAAKMFGFKNTEEGIGINVLDFVAPEHKSIVAKDLVLDKLGRGKPIAEYKAVDRTGRKFWVETLGSKSEFEGKPVDVVSIRDITHRKEIEEEIIKGKNKLEILQENTAALVATLDQDKLLEIIANNARKIFSATLVAVTSFDEKKNHLAIRATAGMDHPIIKQALKILGADPSKLIYKAEEGSVTKWLIDNKKPFVTASLYEMINKQINEKLCLAAQKFTGVKNLIAVPFFVQEKFLGTFILFLKEEAEIDLNYLLTFGNQCAQALNTANIVSEIKNRAEELEKINKFMVGRELDIIGLKEEINSLAQEFGREKKYNI